MFGEKMEGFTSPRLEKKSNISTPFDVNVRAVQAFLSIITLASQTVLNYVHSSVQNAYSKLDQNGSNTVTDIAVSFDGTCLTRGHTSQIGVGCVADTLTGYVIDYEIMSKYCPTCISAKNKLGETTAEYDVWYSGHKDSYQINHIGTSGAMEMKAAVKIWSRSEACDFRYTTLLSDGGAKTKGEKPAPHKFNIGTPINPDYLTEIVPIYQRLASDSLLKECARCLTQNSNESLHSVIWSKCSKETSAKSRHVNIAVSEVVSEYNFGSLISLKEIQKAANLYFGEEAVKIAAIRDYRRKKERNRQSNLAFRISRRKVKLANLRKEKYSKKKEGIT
ncbi:uncharacterized protein TNCV_3934221 [Trichonephila clavipes]|nr:uncharacterized protein TNCV_3934221 [Trichonephila clavipes]